MINPAIPKVMLPKSKLEGYVFFIFEGLPWLYPIFSVDLTNGLS